MMVESWGFGLEAVNVPCVPCFQGPMGESQVSEAKSASAQPVLPIALPALSCTCLCLITSSILMRLCFIEPEVHIQSLFTL